ncbi:conserved Plasmodium protein, unknown function [Plasmodium knowlesi strain H]|uniref:Uncharacterized protein n=3 Tax=Plasmodium knowlesi TaxID=5850 RepID=A0A5E7WXP7_PLAKH|nr:conserved Plasmodium protein, unknown function [Plasmodium knowlesi strain H]OTN67405.1 Uncharacterized protein PKNOH_S06428500 [Plasmodium knowlesi]CAA9987556.1 conserved Plasmodium protein, unknown function [Plasmodium knowlesi strain H]SBO23065.1 conserved Plasmodium protein, unknown function [Plasmodium knowlesi strain H]SBO23725.1 conserved Plasmodium protein, unknown function [Plasmodium knowlesi strain H]VVS77030.1 conserved Plasmodium protein, unknown function [Plasmodium knowlesi s
MEEKEALFHNSINDPYVVNYVWLYGDNMRAQPWTPPEISSPHWDNNRGGNENIYSRSNNGEYLMREISQLSPSSNISKTPSSSPHLEKREDTLC